MTQSSRGADANLVSKLLRSSSTLITKVMQSGGEFNWPEWQPIAQYYVQDGDLLDSASLETCVRLLITHLRKNRFCEGHFRTMLQSGHIQRLLTRLEAIQKHLLTEGQQDKS